VVICQICWKVLGISTGSPRRKADTEQNCHGRVRRDGHGNSGGACKVLCCYGRVREDGHGNSGGACQTHVIAGTHPIKLRGASTERINTGSRLLTSCRATGSRLLVVRANSFQPI
jgi:hypothetical protein